MNIYTGFLKFVFYALLYMSIGLFVPTEELLVEKIDQ